MSHDKDTLIGLLEQAKLWLKEEQNDAIMQKMRTMRLGELNQVMIRIERAIEILQTEKKSICLRCRKRYSCDFSLQALKAKDRMRISGTKMSYVTISCESFEEEVKCRT